MTTTLLRITISLAVWLCAASASAVSLSLSTDAAIYDVSDTITVTLTGDTTGAAAGTAAFVQLTYDGSLVSPLGPATQTPIVSTFGFVSWTQANPACGASVCTVINQITLSPRVPETNPVIGTLQLHVSNAGVVGLGVVASNLDFFGASAPDPIFVTIASIPEPGTAALLGLGLVGLASRERPSRPQPSRGAS